MEISPSAVYGFIGVLVVLVGMLVRGEYRSNSNKAEIDELWEQYNGHVGNRDLHPSSSEIRELKDGMTKINTSITAMAINIATLTAEVKGMNNHK